MSNCLPYPASQKIPQWCGIAQLVNAWCGVALLTAVSLYPLFCLLLLLLLLLLSFLLLFGLLLLHCCIKRLVIATPGFVFHSLPRSGRRVGEGQWQCGLWSRQGLNHHTRAGGGQGSARGHPKAATSGSLPVSLLHRRGTTLRPQLRLALDQLWVLSSGKETAGDIKEEEEEEGSDEDGTSILLIWPSGTCVATFG